MYPRENGSLVNSELRKLPTRKERKMVTKEEPKIMGAAEDPMRLVGAQSNTSQNETESNQTVQLNKSVNFVTVQPIVQPISINHSNLGKSKVGGQKIITRPTARSPRHTVFRSKRISSSKSPNKRTKQHMKNKQKETGSKVFMEPPMRKSMTNHSLNGHSTWQTRTSTDPSSSSLRTTSVRTGKTTKGKIVTHTKTVAMPSVTAPTRSFGNYSQNSLSKVSVKMTGSHVSSADSTAMSMGPTVPYGTSSTLSTSTNASNTTSRFRDGGTWKPRMVTETVPPRAPIKVTTLPLRTADLEAGKTPSSAELAVQAKPIKPSTASAGGQKKGKKKSKDKKKPTTASTTGSEARKSGTSRGSKRSKKSKGSKSSSKGKKGKKGKKEKVKKLNRKVIYKAMKAWEKKMDDEAKNRKKMEWEKNKLFFYWNCVVTRLLDLQKRNYNLKKKEASLKMEKKDGMFHQNWKTMNLARLQREECLDQKRAEFRSMIRELRDSHKRQTDWLFKDIQTYVKDTYLVGQKYVNDVVGIRMEYTKGLTDTMFDARENLRVLEIEQNAKYGPALEEFEEQMRKLRSKIPTERQERLQEMLAKSHGALVELVNVYTTILHHNFIEVCHTANIINELKSVERRLEREMSEMVKRRDKIKERTEYLTDRVSNLRRQVNGGKEARKKLHRVMKDQEALQSKIDLAYIAKEITYQENSRLATALQEMSDRVDKWYMKVKRDFMKEIVLDAAKHEERAIQLVNYNQIVKYLFNVESFFLETIDNFKDHEEFDDQQEGLKVLLGVYRPHTLNDLEREFEGCTESFTTAIIFFKRRLQQHFMSLDDLQFFIRRRNPLSYLNRVQREEEELKKLFSFVMSLPFGAVTPSGNTLTVQSTASMKL